MQHGWGKNSNGDLIHAAAENIGITTNVEAEMRAIPEAIPYCGNKKMRKIILESDSLLMVKIINEAWKVPWVIAEEFDELKQEMTKLEVKTQHIYREGNKLADYLANLAINSIEKTTFSSYQQLLSLGRKIINMEKAQIPSLRCRTKRILQHHAQRC
ncbi:hypothetical protein KY290_020402 [Solanum tuberosum]|uniref:RNase H type-1 domain-containing protein n=1 Tax=Solanum tuberosum TaxID=4113 RepID=A0ABQ7V0A2_SOLTU|nr:hypothetical protein KY290_020402 [Solanum tuberosum]